jgi:hypothetical protein
MQIDPKDDFARDVSSAIEQLRAQPEEPVEASAEDIGARIADKLDAEDEARAVPPVGETINAQAGQRRDAKTGRFASVSPSDAEAPAGAEQSISGAPAGPPPGWSKEAKAAYDQLSPAVKDAVLKREREVSDGFRNLSQTAKDVESILGPRRQSLGRYGFQSDTQVIQHMINLSDWYERDPAGLVAHLMQSARLNPQQFGIAAQQQQMSPQEAADMEMARQQVRAFEANPPPHYKEVRSMMRGLLEQGVASDMRDAYDRSMAVVRSITSGRGSVERKMAASNASLHGAPHGSQHAPARRNGQSSQFGDIADDVRAAMSQLS